MGVFGKKLGFEVVHDLLHASRDVKDFISHPLNYDRVQSVLGRAALPTESLVIDIRSMGVKHHRGFSGYFFGIKREVSFEYAPGLLFNLSNRVSTLGNHRHCMCNHTRSDLQVPMRGCIHPLRIACVKSDCMFAVEIARTLLGLHVLSCACVKPIYITAQALPVCRCHATTCYSLNTAMAPIR